MSGGEHHKKAQNDTSARAREHALDRIRKAQEVMPSPEQWAERIAHGNREALSQAITLTESNKPADLALVDTILQHLGQANNHVASWRLGITGVPGVGKSTFIEQFGQAWIESGHRVAVLAIDPSSGRSGGSILGDKTRMEGLSRHPHAFVRPSPAASALGGVAHGTYEAVLLCEAAGYDRIVVETVGVGQSETAVRELTDVFILLMLPGGGDELQGMKRGIMEMADLLLVNKSDSGRELHAEETANQYRKALHLFPASPGGHEIAVQTISALERRGLQDVLGTTRQLMTLWSENGWLERQRSAQRLNQFQAQVQRLLLMQRWQTPEESRAWHEVSELVNAGQLHPLEAARKWVEGATQSRLPS